MSRREPDVSSPKPEPYALRIKRSAEKAIAAFSDDEQDQIDDALQVLVLEHRPGNAKKIAGHPPLRRLKIPPFRIFYVIDDEARTILILLAERRTGNTYKHLDRLVAGLKTPANVTSVRKPSRGKKGTQEPGA
jgi:mRNA-degrading endonuclease RelE of RelBE toxin-antitoxin system